MSIKTEHWLKKSREECTPLESNMAGTLATFQGGGLCSIS